MNENDLKKTFNKHQKDFYYTTNFELYIFEVATMYAKLASFNYDEIIEIKLDDDDNYCMKCKAYGKSFNIKTRGFENAVNILSYQLRQAQKKDIVKKKAKRQSLDEFIKEY